jgi:hypothetical protein
VLSFLADLAQDFESLLAEKYILVARRSRLICITRSQGDIYESTHKIILSVGLRSFRKRAERAAQRSAFQVAPFNEFIKRRKVLSSARTLSPRGRFIFASAHVKFIL